MGFEEFQPTCQITPAVSEKIYFYLTYNEIEGARVYVTVNKHKIFRQDVCPT
jgi:hypothetical protein